jgi:hypothetical protein
MSLLQNIRIIGKNNVLCQPEGRHIARLFPFSKCWFCGPLQGLYQQMVIAGEEPEGPLPAAAGEGGGGFAIGEEEQVELHGLMTQVFELLLCVVERPQYSQALQPALGQLSQVCITYMQVNRVVKPPQSPPECLEVMSVYSKSTPDQMQLQVR